VINITNAAGISLGSKSSEWIVEAMKKYFDKVDSLDLRKVEVNLTTKGPEVFYEGEEIKHYDCIHCMGTFRYVSLLRSITTALSQKSYMPIKASAFTIGHDKLLTQLKLQRKGIPMPTTYISSSAEGAKSVLESINYPIIMKFPSGTHGKGVMFADSYPAASSMLDALTALKQPFIIQEYVETGGVDIRAIIVGDKVVASMKRKAVKGEKRANIHAGAEGEACELDMHTKKIAVKAAQVIGAEVCAIDLLESVKGPVVIEINVSPGLQGISKATKIDVAEKIAKFLFNKTKSLVEGGKKEEKTQIFKELGIEETAGAKEILTNLDYRANRILLPEFVTEISKLGEEEVVVKVKDGEITIKRMSIGKETKK
jgi:ribosomal protein S6--L-glutamate ligase